MYKFRLKEDRFFPKIKHDFTVMLGQWGTISPKGLFIKRGYCWDGASPKIKFWGMTFGTWDGRDNILKTPTLVHDILCQYKNPFSRKKIDTIFYNMMKEVDFPYALLYYRAVRFWSIMKRKK